MHNLDKIATKAKHALRGLKHEQRFITSAFQDYGVGFQYIYSKYYAAHKILSANKVIERPCTVDDFSMHMLTCRRDIVNTIWSLASFYHVSDIIGNLYIHDDGSLRQEDRQIINKLFPSATIIHPQEAWDRFSEQLISYPAIREFRSELCLPLIKKIIDSYFVSTSKMRLIIDSDLLWFNNPKEIEDAVTQGCSNSYMQRNDIEIFITFNNHENMDSSLAGYNSGVTLYSQSNFDLDVLEKFFSKIDRGDAASLHFSEQSGFAHCLKNLYLWPDSTYIIDKEVTSNTVVCHFVTPRRPLFYAKILELYKELLATYRD